MQYYRPMISGLHHQTQGAENLGPISLFCPICTFSSCDQQLQSLFTATRHRRESRKLPLIATLTFELLTLDLPTYYASRDQPTAYMQHTSVFQVSLEDILLPPSHGQVAPHSQVAPPIAFLWRSLRALNKFVSDTDTDTHWFWTR